VIHAKKSALVNADEKFELESTTNLHNQMRVSTMDQSQDFKSLQDQIQAALIATTRTTGQIASEDLGFQRSFNVEVGTTLDEQSERLLALASALVKSAVSISEIRAPALQDSDDVENNWRSVVDVVDSLLEKSDICLDEYTGVIKRKEPANGEQPRQVTPIFPPPLCYRKLTFQSLLPSLRNRASWGTHSAPRTSSNPNLRSKTSPTMMTIHPGSLFSP
jgi:hypothetical protein